ncbi:MAG: thioredoxin family protein [Deferribacterales bacterium]
MKIKVLGPGCVNCKKMHEMTLQAVKELGIDADIEYVNDMTEISNYIMVTPGLVVDEVVVHEGKPLPTVNDIKILIKQKTSAAGGSSCGCSGCCG